MSVPESKMEDREERGGQGVEPGSSTGYHLISELDNMATASKGSWEMRPLVSTFPTKASVPDWEREWVPGIHRLPRLPCPQILSGRTRDCNI